MCESNVGFMSQLWEKAKFIKILTTYYLWCGVAITFYAIKTRALCPGTIFSRTPCISDNKWPVDGIKTIKEPSTRNKLTLEDSPGKIAHHNNPQHPCPSQHQRSLFGKRSMVFNNLFSKLNIPGICFKTTFDSLCLLNILIDFQKLHFL